MMIVPLGCAKDAASVARALIRSFKLLLTHLRKTLTYGNGREMGQHASFSLAIKVATYFCAPHCQRSLKTGHDWSLQNRPLLRG
jgi:IS30 family transposase